MSNIDDFIKERLQEQETRTTSSIYNDLLVPYFYNNKPPVTVMLLTVVPELIR